MISAAQIADTGGKMIHLGKFSFSSILSKSISINLSQNIYRGLIEISPNALFSKSNAQCGSLLIGNKALTVTLPYLEVGTYTSCVQQEAYISKIQEDEIFLLTQRGLSVQKAFNLIIHNFCETITTLIPSDFAVEFPMLLKSRIEEITY
jgi:Fe-S cluster assembly protein SufB